MEGKIVGGKAAAGPEKGDSATDNARTDDALNNRLSFQARREKNKALKNKKQLRH